MLGSNLYGDFFSTQELREIWSDRSTISFWLQIEQTLALLQAEMHLIPTDAAKALNDVTLENINLNVLADEMLLVADTARGQQACVALAAAGCDPAQQAAFTLCAADETGLPRGRRDALAWGVVAGVLSARGNDLELGDALGRFDRHREPVAFFDESVDAEAVGDVGGATQR